MDLLLKNEFNSKKNEYCKKKLWCFSVWCGGGNMVCFGNQNIPQNDGLGYLVETLLSCWISSFNRSTS